MSGYVIPSTVEELDALVSERMLEGVHIEFKSSRAFGNRNKLKSELPCDASAFANAAGGVIIFGIEEDSENRADAIRGYDREDIDASWFEDVLLNTVSPALYGIDVLSLVHPTGKVFVLHVPISFAAPHQSCDGKYYARRQFRRDVLEHFEIEMLRLRSSGNELGVFGGLSVDSFMLAAQVENSRSTPIYDAKFVFEKRLPENIKEKNIFSSGVAVIPAKTKLRFGLATVYEAFADEVLGGDLPYKFVFRLEPNGRQECVVGRIHLAELNGAMVGERDISDLITTIRKGFTELSAAFGNRRP
jgi:Putative DNA-binding domain